MVRSDENSVSEKVRLPSEIGGKKEKEKGEGG